MLQITGDIRKFKEVEGSMYWCLSFDWCRNMNNDMYHKYEKEFQFFCVSVHSWVN